jgi:hypothetical protein
MCALRQIYALFDRRSQRREKQALAQENATLRARLRAAEKHSASGSPE